MKRARRDWDASEGGMQYGPNSGNAMEIFQPRKLATAKRRRVDAFPRTPRRRYMPRTPGGQIVADNHYYDATRANVAIPVITTAWTGTELDPDNVAAGALAVNCLFAPTLGDDISQRTGRRATLKRIKIQGTIIIPAQTTVNTLDTPAKVRIIVYRDGQTNASQSQGEDLIGSGLGTGTSAMNMFQNFANFGRFKVYKDKSYIYGNNISGVNDTGATGGVVQSAAKYHFKFSIPVNDVVNFNATNGGTVADIVDNSYHLICATDGSTMAPTIAYQSRCVFSP